MCNFLSAIMTRTGSIYCDPEHTDSHTDLIEAFGLKEGRGHDSHFVRLEMTPADGDAGPRYLDLDAYQLGLDQESSPSWWNPDRFEEAKSALRAKLEAMIVADKRKLLLGGTWILADGAVIEKVQSARILAMHGSSQVRTMSGSSQVGEMFDSSQVGAMFDSSQVGEMSDSSQVGAMFDSSQVGEMSDSSQVRTMFDSSRVRTMSGFSRVRTMFGSSQVGAMSDSSQVGEMSDSSQVGEMYGSSQVGGMSDSSQAPKAPVTEKRVQTV